MNFSDPNPQASTPSKSVQPTDNLKITKALLVGIVAGMLILFKITGPVAFYFFSVGDNLNFTYRASPYIIWAVYGAFAGAIYGGFIAVKKFRLKPVFIAYPIGALILLLIILIIYNANFKSHNYIDLY